MRVCAPRRTAASPGFTLDDVALDEQRAEDLPVNGREEITLTFEVRLLILL